MSETLTKVPFGQTDMTITRAGFGAWAIGGGGWAFAWGDQEDDDSVAAIRHAVESGINWVDTAAVYGLGHSEEVVARALRDLPEADRPYVFTKGGLVWDESDRSKAPRRVGRPGQPAPRGGGVAAPPAGWTGSTCTSCTGPPRTGRRWRSTGRRSWTCAPRARSGPPGCPTTTWPSSPRPRRLGHVDSLQPQFSLIHRDAAAELIPWCAAHGTGVIVYSPMGAGLLTGAFTAGAGGRPGPG